MPEYPASVLTLSPVIPVAVIAEPEQAVPLAQALVRGGIKVIEVTLRTAAGIESIRRIAAEVPDMTVGVGTVLDRAQARAAADAGAKFMIAPGSTPALIEAIAETGVPFVPGAGSLSEVMSLRERGFTEMKFFPASYVGGPSFLKAVHDPIPDVRFCPTGGVSPENMTTYLSVPNVSCVGGSWLTPKAALAAGDWTLVEEIAAKAVALAATV